MENKREYAKLQPAAEALFTTISVTMCKYEIFFDMLNNMINQASLELHTELKLPVRAELVLVEQPGRSSLAAPLSHVMFILQQFGYIAIFSIEGPAFGARDGTLKIDWRKPKAS